MKEMNVLQMRGFRAQVEIMGKAVDVSWESDGSLHINGLSLGDVHRLLGILATGNITREGDTPIPVQTKEKAEPGSEENAVSAVEPAKGKRTSAGAKREALPPVKPLERFDYSAPPLLADDDEEEDEDPEVEAAGRAKTEAIRNSVRAARMREPKAPSARRSSKRVVDDVSSDDTDEPEPATAGSNGGAEADPFAPGVALPKELATAMRMSTVVLTLREMGINGETAMVEACERMKDRVPMMRTIKDIPDRVRRALLQTGLATK